MHSASTPQNCFLSPTWSVRLWVGGTGFRSVPPVLTVDEGLGHRVILVARQGDSRVITPVRVLLLLHIGAVPGGQGRLKQKASICC